MWKATKSRLESSMRILENSRLSLEATTCYEISTFLIIIAISVISYVLITSTASVIKFPLDSFWLHNVTIKSCTRN